MASEDTAAIRSDLYALRGHTQWVAGHSKDAQEDIDRAISLNPDCELAQKVAQRMKQAQEFIDVISSLADAFSNLHDVSSK